jgi:UDP-N-acetylmuramate dehydrogenase
MRNVDELLTRLEELGLGDRVALGAALAPYTSYCIGGPADLLVEAQSADDIGAAVGAARALGVPVLVLGGATNVLIADAGVRGLVIINRNVGYQLDEASGELRVQSGTALRELARWATKAGWAGLEWAVGIPGTIGGGLVGNAGAYGGCLADVTLRVHLLLADGTQHWVEAAELGYGYRTSTLKEHQPREQRPIILEAVFQLVQADPQELAARSEGYSEQRKQRTPAGRCAGSVFVRTLQFPAGFLIEQAGLKGYRCGDAEVSPLHANFIMNCGQAKAADVQALIRHVQTVVWGQFAQRLEPEIELVGAWESEMGSAADAPTGRSHDA